VPEYEGTLTLGLHGASPNETVPRRGRDRGIVAEFALWAVPPGQGRTHCKLDAADGPAGDRGRVAGSGRDLEAATAWYQARYLGRLVFGTPEPPILPPSAP